MPSCSLAADDARSVTAKNDVSGMNLTLGANKTYIGEFVLRTTANAATVGVQFSLTFGGTVTRFDGNLEYWLSSTGKGDIAVTNDTATPFDFNPTASQGTGTMVYRLTFRLVVGGTGGTLQLQHGSETATLTTLLAGSYGSAVEA
jgi:hypothetical protein